MYDVCIELYSVIHGSVTITQGICIRLCLYIGDLHFQKNVTQGVYSTERYLGNFT